MPSNETKAYFIEIRDGLPQVTDPEMVASEWVITMPASAVARLRKGKPVYLAATGNNLPDVLEALAEAGG